MSPMNLRRLKHLRRLLRQMTDPSRCPGNSR